MGALLRALWAIQCREGLTSRELARELGVSEAAICRYRAGQRTPSTGVLRQMLTRYPELAIRDLLLAEAGKEGGGDKS